MLIAATAAFLRYTKLGTAMRAMANDREITATLGVPVRRVEAEAWFGCGMLAGFSGLLLADLVGLDAVRLTFLVISSLAAALIAQLRSIAVTFFAAIVIGAGTRPADAVHLADKLPKHDAVRARRDRLAGGVAAPYGHDALRRGGIVAGVDTQGRAEQTVAGQRFGLLRRPERPVHLGVTVALVLFALFGCRR